MGRSFSLMSISFDCSSSKATVLADRFLSGLVGGVDDLPCIALAMESDWLAASTSP